MLQNVQKSPQNVSNREKPKRYFLVLLSNMRVIESSVQNIMGILWVSQDKEGFIPKMGL